MGFRGCGSSRSVELDQNGAHVVHPILTAAVFRNKFVEKFLENGSAFTTVLDTFADPIYHFLVGLDLPDAVTSHNNKIYVFYLCDLHVRPSTDLLFLRL